MWPLLSFSLHSELMTQRAEEPEGTASLQHAVLWQDGVSEAQLPGMDMCLDPTCLHPRGHCMDQAERRIHILKPGRASLLSTPPVLCSHWAG